MRKANLALMAAIVASLSLIGCGGGTTAGAAANPFQGTYSGNWSSTQDQTGTATVDVDSQGHLTGTLVNTTLDISGTVTGTTTPSGNFTGTVTYPEGTPSTINGTLQLAGNGDVVGELHQTVNGSAVRIDLSLQRQQGQL